jgi:protein ImuB
MRTMVLWCPDWPVIAAGMLDGIPVHEPVAVLSANRVLACSPAARADGVRRGLRKREAQGRCLRLIVVSHDPGRDARAYEPVILAVEELAPGVEVIRPGACALAARGPASYYGSESRAAERLVEQIALGAGVEAQAGVAEGVFAALLAARAGAIVPPGQTQAFLADVGIGVIDQPDLADLLPRLGIHTLGAFAALPAADVLGRFGFAAAYAHQLARGRDERPLAVRKPPPDLDVAEEYDPPLDRIDVAAFAARALAERLHRHLAGHGLAATGLGIEARTGAGEELHRRWRHDGLLSSAAIADRVRWQLDGWLTSSAPRAGGLSRPTAGIERLRLIPEGVLRHAGMQSGLWGELGPADERAHRAMVRVQGLLGPDAVVTGVLGGGRSYTDQVRLVAWGDERSPRHPGGEPAPPPSQSAQPPPSPSARPPWPGQLPAPAPAQVLAEPAPAQVLDADRVALSVSARLALSGTPTYLVVHGGQPVQLTGWAGPWPVEERWWAPQEASRVVRFQVTLAGGIALLVALRDGQWFVEACYD